MALMLFITEAILGTKYLNMNIMLLRFFNKIYSYSLIYIDFFFFASF